MRHVLDELRECEAVISPGIFDLAQISARVRRCQAMDADARCQLGFPARGRIEVRRLMTRRASHGRDGEAVEAAL